jgi:hypothetical protein
MAELNCTFVPHVLTITTGQKILLHNRDAVLNTFHAIIQPAGRTLFNIGTPNKGQQIKRRIQQSGIIEMRCDVHPWERAFILSVAHPYHTVTDAKGNFALNNIPSGEYTLTFWHEQLGEHRRKIKLTPGANLKIDLPYPLSKKTKK